MLRHAATGAVLVVISVLITLWFSSRSGKLPPPPPPPSPVVDVRETNAAFKQCDQLLVRLGSDIADALTDEAHRNDRLAQLMSKTETQCTQAAIAIREALASKPGSKRLTQMRDRNALGQAWLRQLSVAIAAYEVAAQTGSASQELAALQKLLQ
jgi:hypothetical protein